MCKACKVDGCNDKYYAKGYCSKHYQQIKRYGSISSDGRRKSNKTCSVEGCDGKHHAHGYCRRHYEQIKRHGCITHTGRSIFDKNEIIEYDDYAEIVLYDQNNNEVARTIIDLDCVEAVKDYKWCFSNGYAYNYQVRQLHRFIMNPPEDMVVDHIDGNKLDNRRDNLRICTHQENDWNKALISTNTSGVTGVVWDKNRNKWLARIEVNGKTINLGGFKEKEDAIQARRQAEIDYFGEYRRQE